MVVSNNVSLKLAEMRCALIELGKLTKTSIVDMAQEFVLFSEDELRSCLEKSLHAVPPSGARTRQARPRTSLIEERKMGNAFVCDPASSIVSVSEEAVDCVIEVPSDDEVLRSSLSIKENCRTSSKSSSLVLTFSTTRSEDPAINEIINNAVYGIEIESFIVKKTHELCTSDITKARDEICPYLEKSVSRCNFKFMECAASKGDTAYTCWKVTTDSSITSEDGRPLFGFEVVSSKLKGWEGLNTTKRVACAMTDYGCATNNTTALHVHVSFEKITNAQVQNFALWYLFFETTIDQFHSYPRRGDSSRYCRSVRRSVLASRYDQTGCNDKAALKTISMVDVSYTQGFNQMIKLLNPQLNQKSNSGRNHKVNFQLLKKTEVGVPSRRVEFRQHAGTCDGEEIVMWARFCTVFSYVFCSKELPSFELEPSASLLWESLKDDVLQYVIYMVVL